MTHATAAMLENLGFSAEVVPDGAEAVKAAALKPYQALLMDCHIPVLDGYEATREIRRTQKSRRTPIIAVTASAMKSDPGTLPGRRQGRLSRQPPKAEDAVLGAVPLGLGRSGPRRRRSTGAAPGLRRPRPRWPRCDLRRPRPVGPGAVSVGQDPVDPGRAPIGPGVALGAPGRVLDDEVVGRLARLGRSRARTSLRVVTLSARFGDTGPPANRNRCVWW